MAYIRDRMIEAGICGGFDLAWNLKRGVGPRSTDALLWRDGGRDRVIDIAAGLGLSQRQAGGLPREEAQGRGHMPRRDRLHDRLIDGHVRRTTRRSRDQEPRREQEDEGAAQPATSVFRPEKNPRTV